MTLVKQGSGGGLGRRMQPFAGRTAASWRWSSEPAPRRGEAPDSRKHRGRRPSPPHHPPGRSLPLSRLESRLLQVAATAGPGAGHASVEGARRNVRGVEVRAAAPLGNENRGRKAERRAGGGGAEGAEALTHEADGSAMALGTDRQQDRSGAEEGRGRCDVHASIGARARRPTPPPPSSTRVPRASCRPSPVCAQNAAIPTHLQPPQQDQCFALWVPPCLTGRFGGHVQTGMGNRRWRTGRRAQNPGEGRVGRAGKRTCGGRSRGGRDGARLAACTPGIETASRSSELTPAWSLGPGPCPA
jgi:hypothetical protein